jgi:hypothetical protein
MFVYVGIKKGQTAESESWTEKSHRTRQRTLSCGDERTTRRFLRHRQGHIYCRVIHLAPSLVLLTEARNACSFPTTWRYRKSLGPLIQSWQWRKGAQVKPRLDTKPPFFCSRAFFSPSCRPSSTVPSGSAIRSSRMRQVTNRGGQTFLESSRRYCLTRFRLKKLLKSCSRDGSRIICQPGVNFDHRPSV